MLFYSRFQGGCGTGYIMDKDGNLHVGRGKIALSRPKMLKQIYSHEHRIVDYDLAKCRELLLILSCRH
jgi:hypothetical protein